MEEMKPQTEAKKDEKSMEMNELNRLIGHGLKFRITRFKDVRQPGFFGRFKKMIRVPEELEFELHEPTLAVMDRLSKEGIEMVIHEKDLQEETSGVSTAKALIAKHSIRMARYVAIAVLGEELFIPKEIGAHVQYKEDTRRLSELTDIFAHTIKPSKLYQLVIGINTIANMGDFTNCIRLASSNRTTIPNLIQ